MGKMNSILITLILTFFILVSFTCSSLPEITKLIPSNTNIENTQPKETRVMVATTGQGYTRVSLSIKGDQLNGPSYYATISDDGRYIAFKHWNLTGKPQDDMGSGLPIYDRIAKKLITLADVDYPEKYLIPPDLISFSANGRYIAFSSKNSTLVSNDINAFAKDIFVRDMQNNTTTMVSLGSINEQGTYDSGNPHISADGRYVSFETANILLVQGNLFPGYNTYYAGGSFNHVFVRDVQANVTHLVSAAYELSQGIDWACYHSRMSADGRYVVFDSPATNIIPDDNNGNDGDVFMRDLKQNKTTLVSVASNGAQANNSSSEPSVSADGRYILFESEATNLAQNMVYDGQPNLFIRDLMNNTTKLVVTNFGGIRDRKLVANKTADGIPMFPRISGDGRYVTFLLTKGTDIRTFDVVLHDVTTNLSTRLASGTCKIEDISRYAPSISYNGTVAFASDQENLISGDTNGQTDIFVFYHNVPMQPPTQSPSQETMKPQLINPPLRQK